MGGARITGTSQRGRPAAGVLDNLDIGGEGFVEILLRLESLQEQMKVMNAHLSHITGKVIMPEDLEDY